MRLFVCLGVAVVAALAASPLSAQDYPSRPTTIVVPLAAGTGLDVIARSMASGSRKASASRSWWRTGPARA